MRYVVVEFHDNDFGRSVVDALSQLWLWIKENNAHMLSGGSFQQTDRTMTDIFSNLHRSGALAKLLERTIYLYSLLNQVEHSTRGLSYDEVDWVECGNYKSGFTPDQHTEDYITIDTEAITITDKPEIPEHTNGEWFILDIEDGVAWTAYGTPTYGRESIGKW